MSHATSRFQAPALRRSLAVAMFAAGVVAPVPALAAFDMYLKIDSLTGDVTAPGFVNTMLVVGYANGVKRSAFTPTCEPMAITKTVDKASPILMKAAFVGTPFSKVELDLVRNGAIFLKYEMTAGVNIGVTEDSGEAGAASPLENLLVNYTRVTITYFPTGAPSIASTLDCARGTAS